MTTDQRADRFRADCSRCVGLCCVGLERTRAGGFGADLPAGVACPHLMADDRCGIHSRLRAAGWPACDVFDCFGAGQQVTQVTFGGTRSWRDDPRTAGEMFAAFGVMRHLMEMLRLLDEAHALAAGALRDEVAAEQARLEELAAADAGLLAVVDLPGIRGRVGPLLQRVGDAARSPGRTSRRLGPRAQLLGAVLRGQDLSRLCLRSALLIAADLRGCRFDATDLLGADLRDATVAGADLSGAIFLTQQQVDAARGDLETRLPSGLRRPGHW